jgi:hypothetical protein
MAGLGSQSERLATGAGIPGSGCVCCRMPPAQRLVASARFGPLPGPLLSEGALPMCPELFPACFWNCSLPGRHRSGRVRDFAETELRMARVEL